MGYAHLPLYSKEHIMAKKQPGAYPGGEFLAEHRF